MPAAASFRHFKGSGLAHPCGFIAANLKDGTTSACQGGE
jgi:hypothetical protein